jgi:hypothetical protein
MKILIYTQTDKNSPGQTHENYLACTNIFLKNPPPKQIIYRYLCKYSLLLAFLCHFAKKIIKCFAKNEQMCCKKQLLFFNFCRTFAVSNINEIYSNLSNEKEMFFYCRNFGYGVYNEWPSTYRR